MYLALPKEFLNDSNDSKLTMLGGRLFQTLIIRSLKMFSHINVVVVIVVVVIVVVDHEPHSRQVPVHKIRRRIAMTTRC